MASGVAPTPGLAGRVLRRATDPAVLFIVPATFAILFILIGPNLGSFALAFTNWATWGKPISFVGVDNFAELWGDGSIGRLVATTVGYAILTTVFVNVFALLIALALEANNRVNWVFRSIFFLPVILSTLSSGFVWKGLLKPDGPVNAVLGAIMQTKFTFPWLGSSQWTLVVVALIAAWQALGIAMLIYIAGLAIIPSEVVEAARVDGGHGWRIVRSIKLPLLLPALTFNIILTLISAFNAFDIIFATTFGGPGTATTTVNLFIYRQYANGYFGLASAGGLLLVVLVAAGAMLLVTYLRRREVYA